MSNDQLVKQTKLQNVPHETKELHKVLNEIKSDIKERGVLGLPTNKIMSLIVLSDAYLNLSDGLSEKSVEHSATLSSAAINKETLIDIKSELQDSLDDVSKKVLGLKV